MAYSAPIRDMRFVIQDLCGFDQIARLPGLEDATTDTINAVLDEAGKFASQILSPLNRVGDLEGASWGDGTVTTAPGWSQAYGSLVEMGWNCPTANPEHGGMGLPAVVNACIQEMFQGANVAFALCSMLTQGAIDSIEQFASDDLKTKYLDMLVSGQWTGTMNLTESQAGSDLAAVRASATPVEDYYLIKGQKIFISYGDQDLTENIVHLVLARLPDAPEGVKGISLFLVPKYCLKEDGTPGDLNDLRCVSIEHKLGIHASPTCTMAFGDDGGAKGYLIGEPHQGLHYMFAMMNNARLNVGIQGIGIGEHAYQDALTYALDRKQGGSRTIVEHADVRRMLTTMKVKTEAMRILAYRAAASLDFAQRSDEKEICAYHQRRVDLLIPIIKAFATEQSIEIASLGMQVHGGMGFVEETGVAQHLRDARITTIYEGTTGIQALDLVGRKILRDRGRAVEELIAELMTSAERLEGGSVRQAELKSLAEMVSQAAKIIQQTTQVLTASGRQKPDTALGCANSVLDVFGCCLSAWALGDAAHAASNRMQSEGASDHLKTKLPFAEFYRTQIFPTALAKQSAVMAGVEPIMNVSVEQLCCER